MMTGSGCFTLTSTGLASGNHILEAISHGICEVVERDATTLWHAMDKESQQKTRIDLNTIDDPTCAEVVEKFMRADVAVAVWEMTTDVGIPAFLCVFAEPAAESTAALAKALAPLRGRRGVETILFPQGRAPDLAHRGARRGRPAAGPGERARAGGRGAPRQGRGRRRGGGAPRRDGGVPHRWDREGATGRPLARGRVAETDHGGGAARERRTEGGHAVRTPRTGLVGPAPGLAYYRCR